MGLSYVSNVFLFVFATMMLAVVAELWSIATILKTINDTLERYERKLHGNDQNRDQSRGQGGDATKP